MQATWLLWVSLASLVLGIMCFLFPSGLAKLSSMLNHSVVTMDQAVLRYRYVVGALALILSYGLFNIVMGGIR